MKGSEENGRDAGSQHSDTTPGTSQQGQSTGLTFSGAELSVVLNTIHCLVYSLVLRAELVHVQRDGPVISNSQRIQVR